jgi:hypothetical protein
MQLSPAMIENPLDRPRKHRRYHHSKLLPCLSSMDEVLAQFDQKDPRQPDMENLRSFDNAIANILCAPVTTSLNSQQQQQQQLLPNASSIEALSIPPLNQLLSFEPKPQEFIPDLWSPYSKPHSFRKESRKRSREHFEGYIQFPKHQVRVREPSPEVVECNDSQVEYSDIPSPIIAPPVDNLIKLVTTLCDESVKISGGKDNKDPLPRQTVILNLRVLPIRYRPSNLYVRVSLMGFTKNHEPKIVIKDIGRTTVASVPVQYNQDIVELHFDNIIVTQSSHNHGQKLFLRFSLIDGKNRKEPTIIGQLDTNSFQTITRRGKQKQREKNRAKMSPSITLLQQAVQQWQQLVKTIQPKNLPMTSSVLQEVPITVPESPTESSSPIQELLMQQTPSIVQLEPSFALTRGGQLIKIHLKNAEQYSKNVPLVFFDRDPCRRVISFDGNTILCEAPSKPAGFCAISISFNNCQSFIGNSSIGVTYIAESPSVPVSPPVITSAMQKNKIAVNGRNLGTTSVMSQLFSRDRIVISE